MMKGKWPDSASHEIVRPANRWLAWMVSRFPLEAASLAAFDQELCELADKRASRVARMRLENRAEHELDAHCVTHGASKPKGQTEAAK